MVKDSKCEGSKVPKFRAIWSRGYPGYDFFLSGSVGYWIRFFQHVQTTFHRDLMGKWLPLAQIAQVDVVSFALQTFLKVEAVLSCWGFKAKLPADTTTVSTPFRLCERPEDCVDEKFFRVHQGVSLLKTKPQPYDTSASIL